MRAREWRRSRSRRPCHQLSPDFLRTTCAWPLLRLLIQHNPSAAPLVAANTHSSAAVRVLAASTVQLIQVRTTFTVGASCSRIRSLYPRCASAIAVRKLSTCLSRSEAYLLHIAVRRCFKGSLKARSDSLFDATCFSTGGIISIASAANAAMPRCPEKAAETRALTCSPGCDAVSHTKIVHTESSACGPQRACGWALWPCM